MEDGARACPTRRSRRMGGLLAASAVLFGAGAAASAAAPSAIAPSGAAQVTTSTKPSLPPLPGTPTPTNVPTSTVVAAATTTGLPVTVPPTTLAPVTAAGADYVTVTDDWGVLTMDVPTAWPYVVTAPFVSGDRTLRPAISAVTVADFETFVETSTAAGVVYEAYPRTEQFEPLLANVPPLDCVDGGRTPFDDGVYVGTMQAWNFCGGGTARMFVVAANAPGATFTAGVWIKTLTAADEAQATHVLGSLSFDPAAPMPTVTVPTTLATAPTTPPPTIPAGGVPPTVPPTAPVPVPPTSSAGGVPPTSPAGGVPPTVATTTGGTVALTDDLGRLSVDVPAAWSDVNLAPAADEDDTTAYPAITAAVDVDAFNAGYAASGVYLRELPLQDDPTAYVTSIARGELATDCTDGGVVPYTSATFTGAVHTWNDCDGTTFDVTVAALNPSTSPGSTVFVILQTDDAESGVVAPLIDSIVLAP